MRFISTKQVCGDRQGFDWPGEPTVQSGAPELPKPPSVKRQHQSEPLKCPRCGSSNTKFCYYNNYKKSQPRHYCKSCKRHWTKGGTLRNVPIGCGRKNKRPKISNAAKDTATTTPPPPPKPSPNSTGLNVSAPQDPIREFDQFSSLSTFDMNPIFYHESLNAFDHYIPGNIDSVEESTITTVNNIPSSSSVPWPGPNTDSSLDLPNYWNWNEIDELASSDHLNISWDDDDDDDDGGAEIKP